MPFVCMDTEGILMGSVTVHVQYLQILKPKACKRSMVLQHYQSFKGSAFGELHLWISYREPLFGL